MALYQVKCWLICRNLDRLLPLENIWLFIRRRVCTSAVMSVLMCLPERSPLGIDVRRLSVFERRYVRSITWIYWSSLVGDLQFGCGVLSSRVQYLVESLNLSRLMHYHYVSDSLNRCMLYREGDWKVSKAYQFSKWLNDIEALYGGIGCLDSLKTADLRSTRWRYRWMPQLVALKMFPILDNFCEL